MSTSKPEYDLALQEAVAVVTTFREAAHGGRAANLSITTDTKLFVHVLGVIAVLALEEVDHLGGDGSALLREIGIKAARRLA